MPSMPLERLDTISNVDDRKQDEQNLDSSFTVQIFSDMDPEIGTNVRIDIAPYEGANTKEKRVNAADDLEIGEKTESVALMLNQGEDSVANLDRSKQILAELVIIVKKVLRYESETSSEHDRREAKHHRSFLADIVAPQYTEESLSVPDLSSPCLTREYLDI